MKKCILISDSFKGTLSSESICEIGKSVFEEISPDCELLCMPVADGGEGTVTCFAKALSCRRICIPTTGPYGEQITAEYALSGDTAIFEISSVAGLPQVGKNRNPAITTSYGMGALIKDALTKGAKKLIIGLGGSATNDGGCGMASALGVKFFDSQGTKFIPLGETLTKIKHLDVSEAKKLLSGAEMIAMCDVKNPLYGSNGAASIFAPQKGASPQMVIDLDRGLRNLSDVIVRDLGVDISKVEGAGAAGGIGGGIVGLLGGNIKMGIETVLDVWGFSEKLNNCDLVITGEGCLDSQSSMGKVIDGVLNKARMRGVPTVAIVGAIKTSLDSFYNLGLTAAFSINQEPLKFENVKGKTAENYRITLKNILRLLSSCTH